MVRQILTPRKNKPNLSTGQIGLVLNEVYLSARETPEGGGGTLTKKEKLSDSFSVSVAFRS